MTDATTWMDAAHRDTSLSDGAVRLVVLLARDDCSVRGESVVTTDDLADRLGCSASTAARRINELAEAGYLADRSKKRVMLSMPDADDERTDEPGERTSEPAQLTRASSEPADDDPDVEQVDRRPKLAAKEARVDEQPEDEPEPEPAPEPDTYAWVMATEDAAQFVDRLFRYLGDPISKPGALWAQVSGRLDGASFAQKKQYLAEKATAIAEDEKDYDRRAIRRFLVRDVDQWRQVVDAPATDGSGNLQTDWADQLGDMPRAGGGDKTGTCSF